MLNQPHPIESPTKPNFLWITCEDISPYLGCYGCEEAHTPYLDSLAAKGIRYTHAYANAPVCAVARSALLTGMHSSTIGTHQMRSYIQLPESIPAYPKLLRKAGYYCTNNSKKDYNSNFLNDSSLWDESSNKAHWKNRSPGQPFFAVFNITTTHESQLSKNRIAKHVKNKQIPETPRINPWDIELPPYHPDLREIREDWSKFHDLITLMDRQAGQRLHELNEEKVAEDTIIFFYSDHGRQLARSKRYIYNVGTQVPLIIYIPEKWKHLLPSETGSTLKRLVQFVDLPKTVLSLAGVEIPKQMQGHVLLGSATEKAPDTIHFYRDRMGERYDFCRAVTDGRYYFIENFMPHRPQGRDTRYGPKVQANWRVWEQHYDTGQCNAIQSQFFQPKMSIELFDTRYDLWHVKNLATDPTYRKTLLKLQKDLEDWMVETRDIGFIPEPLFYQLVGPDKPHKTLYEYAQSDAYPVKRILHAAQKAASADPRKQLACLKMLSNNHPVVRHWGAYGLFLIRSQDSVVKTALRTMIEKDAFAGNRVIAAQALAVCGDPDTAFEILMKEAAKAENGYVFLFALNALQYSGIDNRLTKTDWQTLSKKKDANNSRRDNFGFEYAKRIIDDALDLWSKQRKVD